ncbi:methyl-accepting chemotaxis protein [Sporosarcina sp. resist]|uniref:methyl-accepting chemotaxis protein n=1 Tax=Sporosarcina sp. resist TaxID=2762563 RepID=UPI00164D0A25|nr:methyl-accepting chemotaxis protein [Sporosarcina sp. resist]QNK87302.1 methyl-accepting chemotaxis protein [Sporosarcina sp. resist]
MKTIRAKIWAGFGVVVILATFLGLNGATGIKNLVKTSEDITNEQLPMLITDSRLAFNIADRVALSRGYILYGDNKYIEEFNRLTEESALLQEELKQISDSENVKRLIASSIEWREVLTDQVFPAVKAGRQAEAERLDREIAEPLADEIVNEFNALAVSRQDKIVADGMKNVEKGKKTQVTNFTIAIVVIFLAILISFYVARSISRPVVAVSQRMERMAEGILNDPPLETKLKDEVGQQIHSINKMRDEMQRILADSLTISRQVNSRSTELSETSGIVSDSTSQIAATMEQLAAGSEAQANTASNMAEMVGTFFEDVQHANEAGGQVVESSRAILQRTVNGNEMMESSVEQMNEIYGVVNKSVETIKQLDNQTKEISSLVTVISEIAAQTNLLALNAAIEAARAGEHGKGFAVVADEVKKLAEQVANSVSEITTIVDTVQIGSSSAVKALESGYQSVADGKQKVLDTGVVFEEISKLVTEMNKLTNVMSADLDHLEEIGGKLTEGVTEVASIAEESAAGVQETTASAEQTSFQVEAMREAADELSSLSEALETSVSRFAIEERKDS